MRHQTLVKNSRIAFAVLIAVAVVLELAGCADSDNKPNSPQSSEAPVVKLKPKVTHNLVPKLQPTYQAKSTPPAHQVIYKEGEYPTRPSWMTQKQWDSYIEWESNRQTKRETPRWDEDAKLLKILRRRLGSHLREASTTKGSDQNDPVQGWVAEVDIYSNRNQADADRCIAQVSETVFASRLNVNRVIVNVCLHEQPIDGTIYTVQVDKGQEPKTLVEFDPSG